MSKPSDLSRSTIPFKQDDTLIAVVEVSQSSWLVAGIVPGVSRQPLKKLAADEKSLLKLVVQEQPWHIPECGGTEPAPAVIASIVDAEASVLCALS